MLDLSAETLFKQVRSTSPEEWTASGLGVVYVILIMRRHRWGWVAGGLSSLIFTVVFGRQHLPMQALLQFSYVVASVYGWCHWGQVAEQQRITLWRWKGHVVAVLLSVLASLVLAWLLGREGYSAWPFLDSLLFCLGMFATWLVARVYLENWAYWIVIDGVSIFLCLSQGLVVPALLFCIYLAVAALGLRSWWHSYRAGGAPA
ncbi:MAG TPA: nicotinamide riboside transporter PnuC [Steroidobacteraceae bacterium]|nr:nicotinamide riboside transporter PnuC [Steroidobacteraceae bacterium]